MGGRSGGCWSVARCTIRDGARVALLVGQVSVGEEGDDERDETTSLVGLQGRPSQWCWAVGWAAGWRNGAWPSGVASLARSLPCVPPSPSRASRAPLDPSPPQRAPPSLRPCVPSRASHRPSHRPSASTPLPPSVPCVTTRLPNGSRTSSRRPRRTLSTPTAATRLHRCTRSSSCSQTAAASPGYPSQCPGCTALAVRRPQYIPMSSRPARSAPAQRRRACAVRVSLRARVRCKPRASRSRDSVTVA